MVPKAHRCPCCPGEGSLTGTSWPALRDRIRAHHDSRNMLSGTLGWKTYQSPPHGTACVVALVGVPNNWLPTDMYVLLGSRWFGLSYAMYAKEPHGCGCTT